MIPFNFPVTFVSGVAVVAEELTVTVEAMVKHAAVEPRELVVMD